MEYSSEQLGGTIRFMLNGKLTFSDNASFQNIASVAGQPHIQHLELNLGGLDYIDSSGIGMLLVLKEKCDEVGASMALQHPKGQVEKILRVACIDRIITVT